MITKYIMIALAATPIVAFGGEKPDSKEKAIDKVDMNFKVRPGENFVEFAGGEWLKKTKIPDDKTSFGVFDLLRENSIKDVQAILLEASNAKNTTKGSPIQKIGDFYAAGMDSTAIEKLGATPIMPYIKANKKIKTTKDLSKAITDMHANGIDALFGAGVEQDFENSRIYKMYVSEGGLGMPDRDYYMQDTQHNKDLQAAYKELITKDLILVGYSKKQAEQAANNIYNLEYQLAKASNTRLQNRSLQLMYNPIEYNELLSKYKSFDWKNYFASTGVDFSKDKIIVTHPKFMAAMDSLINVTPISTWIDYLNWNVINSMESSLSSQFVNNNFDFYGKALSGQQVISPRWKRMSNQVDRYLGEAVGQLYVQRHFPPEAKERMVTLIENLRKAYRHRIENVEWMSDQTKAKAYEKLNKMMVKVGYPDKWKDYSSMNISKNSHFNNILEARRFMIRENYNKYGKPVDITEWGMTPQTVNAYYNPLNNEIVFPAGILQPPFFNMEADDAVNYGAIGMVIGHEMTHGFDDEGKQFDANGNMTNWWTDEDSKQFTERTKRVIEQYNDFVMLDSLHINGELTIGENIADNGGLNIAWDAYQIALDGKQGPTIDGFNDTQRFFLGYAKVWRQKMRDKEIIRRLKEDVHSPALARVNRAIFNIAPLYEAFEISTSDPLYIAPEKRIKIW